MSKLIKADDFQFQGPGGIFFDRIELILAIPDFDMIEVTARGESILLEFGDDIRMEFPSDQLLPLIVKIAAEASIESALQVIEGLGVDLLLRSGILVCEESVRPIQEQLDGIRGVYGLLLEAARGPLAQRQLPDGSHVSLRYLEEDDQKRGQPTSIEKWHQEWQNEHIFDWLDHVDDSDDKAA